MRPTRRPPAETESDLVVAILRTAFIVLIAFSPILLPYARPTARLQGFLFLAGLYNLGLLVSYWRGFRFPYRREITVAIDLLLITLWIFYSGPLGTYFFPLYYITVIVAGFWFGVVGALTSAAFAALFYLAVTFSLPSGPEAGRLVSEGLHRQIPLLFIIAGVISYIAGVQAKEHRGWYEARVFLARHQERIRLAQRVYDLLLPGPLPVLPGLDLGVRFRPAGHSGAGDYYEVIPISDGNPAAEESAPQRVGLAVADVAGKLEPGLVKLPLFKSTLRVCARTSRAPANLLAEANRLLFPDLQPEMFVSLSYGVLDLKSLTLTCAVAGQEPPFLVRGPAREVTEISASGLVLGVLPQVAYDEQTLRLEVGDTLILFTDGATEAQNLAGEDFGLSRLQEAARAADAPDLSAQALADRLMELIITFSSPHGRRDDITILVAKVMGR